MSRTSRCIDLSLTAPGGSNLMVGHQWNSRCWESCSGLGLPRSSWSGGARCAPPGPRTFPRSGMQSALHAATATLPHLRRGLTARTAEHAVPHLRALTGAAAIALADTARGARDRRRGPRAGAPGRPAVPAAREHAGRPRAHRAAAGLLGSDLPAALGGAGAAGRAGRASRNADRVLPRGRPPEPGRAAGRSGGGQPACRRRSSCRWSPSRSGGSRRRSCARCAPRSRRTSSTTRSPQSLATSTSGPEEARELLIDFAEFTRYLFRDGRSYVTLGEEIEHVERYLRLEQARFREPARDRRRPRGGARARRARDVDPAAGRERRPPRCRAAGRLGARRDHGARGRRRRRAGGHRRRAGIEPERVPAVLAGAGGGIGLSNVDARLRATFGERYALRIESRSRRGHHRADDGPQPPGRARRDRARRSCDERRRGLTVLAVDDEHSQLQDLARLLRSSPAVEAVECAIDGHDALVKASGEALRRDLSRRADAGPRRVELGARAAPVRDAAAARVRERVRQRGGRRVRAAGARLPAQARRPPATRGGARARRSPRVGERRPTAARPGRRARRPRARSSPSPTSRTARRG